MKRLLFILISSLFYMNCLAKEITIQLCKDNASDRIKDKRSLSVEPTGTYDENIIRIYSNMTIENVSIVIKDQSDNVIYSNTSIVNSRCHTFEVFDLLKDGYILELKIGNDSFYGCFSN